MNTSKLVLNAQQYLCQIIITTLIGLLASGIAQPSWANLEEISVESQLLAQDGTEGDNFGANLAIDGNIMVVAAPWANNDESSGLVYVYTRESSSEPWEFYQHLIPEQGSFEDNFQLMSLAIQDNTIVVGAPYARVDVVQEGAVYIFEPDDQGIWLQSKRITDVSVGTFGHFGTSLALEGDLLAIGAPETSLDRHGRVGIFERNRGGDNEWGRITTLYGYANFESSVDDAGNARNFGSALAIKNDLLFIGSSRASVSYLNMYDGAVYLFHRNDVDPDQWDYQSRIVAPGADQCVNGEKLSEFILHSTTEENIEARRCAQEDINTSHDFFGDQISLYHDQILIGAYSTEHDENGDKVGAAYLFEQNQTNPDQWQFVRKFQNEQLSGFAYLGSALSMAENTIMVGARYETADSLQNMGAVYVYERDPEDAQRWNEVERLIAVNRLSRDNFGIAVAIDDNTRVIGSSGHSERRGSVYFYEPPVNVDEPIDCQPAFTSTSQLVDGNVFRSDSGVIIGTVPGTLSQSVQFWINDVSAPVDSLFSGAVALGGYYNIGARCTTYVSQQSPYVIGLPVPEATDSTNLAAAVLVPSEDLTDSSDSGFFWQPLTGYYDAGNQMYFVTVAALLEQGSTFVLIEHPNLGPLPVFGPNDSLASGRNSAPAFIVTCVGFGSDGCGLAESAEVQKELIDAYVVFSNEGFREPALAKFSGYLTENGISVRLFENHGYTRIYIRPSASDSCDHIGGQYSGSTEAITICLEENSMANDEIRGLVRHELFHAVQNAYPEVRYNNGKGLMGKKPPKKWIMEGTAEVAVESEAQTRRTWGKAGTCRPLRRIDIPLEHENGESGTLEAIYPYQAQDFWTYLFRAGARDLNLGTLHSFFELGARTETVVERLEHENPPSLTFNKTLRDEYWGWVKNQVYEKSEVKFDNSISTPCNTFSKPLANQCTLEEQTKGEVQFMFYPTSDFVVGPLENLDSQVVQIQFNEAVADATIKAEGGNEGALKYKIYVQGEQNCLELPDGDDEGRKFDLIEENTIIYVVVSNTNHGLEPPVVYQVSVIHE